MQDARGPFDACDFFGAKLAYTAKEIWDKTPTSDQLEIMTQKDSYVFRPVATAVWTRFTR